MRERQLRAKFCDTALEYIGCCENDGSHTEIIEKYNSFRPLPDGRELNRWGNWNAAFIAVVAADCGLEKIIAPQSNAEEMIKFFEAAGRCEPSGSRPDIGDIVVFTRGADGVCERLGIIYAQDGGSITVIEGDKDGAVDFLVLDIESEDIIKYCCPDYRTAAKLEDKRND